MRVLGIVFIIFLQLSLFAQSPNIKCNSSIKIAENLNGFGTNLDDGDMLGISVSVMNDINGDGINEILVGSQWDGDGQPNTGAVYILFPDSNGQITKTYKLGGNTPKLGHLLNGGDEFGYSVTSISDINQDGIDEIVASAYFAGNNSTRYGAIFLISINKKGDVKKVWKYDESNPLLGKLLSVDDRIGACVASLGDLNGDGKEDIAISAHHDDDAGTDAGAFYIWNIDNNGAISSIEKIIPNTKAFNNKVKSGEKFGYYITPVQDLDGDGLNEVAVGSLLASDLGEKNGAVSILFIDKNFKVKSVSRISPANRNFSVQLPGFSGFSRSITSPGDINRDGIPDLLVGVHRFNTFNQSRSGNVMAVSLTKKGTIDSCYMYIDSLNDRKTKLKANDLFGVGIASGIDYNGDGINDLVVSAKGDDHKGRDKGAVYLFCGSTGNVQPIGIPDNYTNYDRQSLIKSVTSSGRVELLKENVVVDVYRIDGVLLESTTSSNQAVNLQHIPLGTYIVVARDEQGNVESKKLVKL